MKVVHWSKNYFYVNHTTSDKKDVKPTLLEVAYTQSLSIRNGLIKNDPSNPSITRNNNPLNFQSKETNFLINNKKSIALLQKYSKKVPKG